MHSILAICPIDGPQIVLAIRDYQHFADASVEPIDSQIQDLTHASSLHTPAASAASCSVFIAEM
jgi:hypothetical protein